MVIFHSYVSLPKGIIILITVGFLVNILNSNHKAHAFVSVSKMFMVDQQLKQQLLGKTFFVSPLSQLSLA